MMVNAALCSSGLLSMQAFQKLFEYIKEALWRQPELSLCLLLYTTTCSTSLVGFATFSSIFIAGYDIQDQFGPYYGIKEHQITVMAVMLVACIAFLKVFYSFFWCTWY